MSESNTSSTSCFSNPTEKIINWTQYYIYFSKPACFVKGLFFAHGFVENAVLNQFVFYLSSKEYSSSMSLPMSAATYNAIDGVRGLLVLITAHLAAAHFGYFVMVISTTAAYISALALLLASEIRDYFSQEIDVTIIFLALVQVALGSAGYFAASTFLSYQIADDDDDDDDDKDETSCNNEDKVEKVNARSRVWELVSKSIGSIISAFFVLEKSWREIFWTSMAVMGAAFFLFLCGIYFGPYKPGKPRGSPLTAAYMVFKGAIRKRHLDYPHSANGYYFLNDNIEERELQISPHHPILRWIDKAAIIVESSSSPSSQETTASLEESSSTITHESKENLSSVEEVKKVKRILTLFPLWTTFLVYSLIQATGNTIFLVQSDGLDFHIANNNYKISFNAFFILRSGISVIPSLLFYLLVQESWSAVQKRRVALVRIGVGMVISVLFCLVAWRTEVRRMRLYKLARMREEITEQIPMSIFWLTPQFIMLGLMDGLVDNGLTEFYNNYVDKSMKFFESPFNFSVLAVQRFLSILFIAVIFQNWIEYDNMGCSGLDKYYLMLAILSAGNLCYHALVSYKYAGKAL